MIDLYCGDSMKKLVNNSKNKKLDNGNDSIDKSLRIIERERKKIKEEKRKIKLEKEEKFYNTRLGKFIIDFFDVSDDEIEKTKVVKRRLFYNFMNVIFGGMLCLVVLFILSGGKNYLKLYNDLRGFIDVYSTISNEYYGDLDKDEIVDAAIDSMIDSVGDAYTTYTDKENTESFMENLQGTYEGIGCMVAMNEDNDIYVVEVFEDMPADKAGLKVNDIILSIDGIDYTDKTSDDMSSYVKEKAKNKISVVAKRNDEEIKVDIVREKVEIPSVTSEIIEQDEKKIGYIKIDIFSSIANNQFKSNLKKLEKKGIQGLIIDVRNNTGGYLNVVTDISSLFLKENKVIYQLETDDKKEKIKDKTDEFREYPVVVLVNTVSASASEILAASIKESYANGYVVGTNTYGKGTVQKTKILKNGKMIKYTIQKWLTPKGEYIADAGVAPTDAIVFTESGFRDDSQLDYAINLLKEKVK